MIDQRVSEGETINLFNKYCLTTTLPTQLALKYDLNIVQFQSLEILIIVLN